jgi:hypothetical protein
MLGWGVSAVRHRGGLDAFYRPGEGEEWPGCEGGMMAGAGALLRLRFRMEVGRREGKQVGEEENGVMLGFTAC